MQFWLPLQVDVVNRRMSYYFSKITLVLSLGMHMYIYSETEFAFSLSIEGIINITLSSKYANPVCGLCGNFNSDATNDLVASDTQETRPWAV